MSEATNSEILAGELSKLLNPVEGYIIHCQILPGFILNDPEGQLVYNSGNCVKMDIYVGGVLVVTLKTVDNFDHNGIVKNSRSVKHHLDLWVNRSAAQTNWLFLSRLPHHNGQINRGQYLQSLENLVRYTDSCDKLTGKMLNNAIWQKLAN